MPTMNDVLLGSDILLDLCRENGEHYQIAQITLRRMQTLGIRPWALVGEVRWLLEQLTQSLESRSTAAARLSKWTQGIQWLAALAEDGSVFDTPHPEIALISRALSRAPSNTLLLTRNPDALREIPGAMEPTVFLEQTISSPSLKFVDLAAQQDRLRSSLEHNIHKVLHHGQYIMGPEVKQLESALAAFSGASRCVTCASGTDALLMALMSLEIGPGDVVFIPAFSFMATAEVVALLGAELRFIDIDPRTFNMDPLQLEAEIKTCQKEKGLTPRCIIPVDLFGLPADYSAIRAVASQYGLFVLADSAQGFGSTCGGVFASSLADATAISFFPAKPLGCYGDGGAILTNDSKLADRFVSLREHGKGGEKYENVRIGLNSRLDTLQAAILLPKLTAFPEELQSRRTIAALYSVRLANEVTTPISIPNVQSSWAQYGILVDHRDIVQQKLAAEQIPTAVYYPKPLPFQKAFAAKAYPAEAFPVATSVSQTILHLPMYADLSLHRVEQITDTVIRVVQQVRMASL